MDTTGSAFPYDYFVSRRGSVAAVAREVADILEGADYKVKVQGYDFTRSGRFVLDIHDALKQCRDLLILHSQDYDTSFWTREEFAHFLSAAAASLGERRVWLMLTTLLNHAGSFFLGSGDASAALPLFRRALVSSARVLGAEHPTTRIFRANYKTTMQKVGQKVKTPPRS